MENCNGLTRGDLAVVAGNRGVKIDALLVSRGESQGESSSGCNGLIDGGSEVLGLLAHRSDSASAGAGRTSGTSLSKETGVA